MGVSNTKYGSQKYKRHHMDGALRLISRKVIACILYVQMLDSLAF